MLSFELNKDSIIVEIKKDIFYENFKIYKNSFDFNQSQEINTGYNGKIIMQVDLKEIKIDKYCLNSIKNKKIKKINYIYIENKTKLYFKANNIIEINLSTEFKFYNENLKNKKIPISINSFFISKEKIKQIECLLKIKNF